MSDHYRGFDIRHPVGLVDFVASDLDTAATEAVHLSREPQGQHVHLLNAYSVTLAEKDPAYLSAVQGSAINLPDGKPIGWVSALRRDESPLKQMRGVDFFLRTVEVGLQHELSHFLLGSTPSTLSLLEASLKSRFPGVTIAGTFSPPFRALTDAEFQAQDELISASGAQIVWVGLGTPKQDFEAARLSKALPVTTIAVGAAFDFVAGTISESPRIINRLGLEWAYRLCREPRRLWRRYLIGNVEFLRIAVRSWASK